MHGFVDGVVGNSSSGVLEAPSMCVGTIDIGDRQKGRVFASSIIHCEPNLNSIRGALKQLYSPLFISSYQIPLVLMETAVQAVE